MLKRKTALILTICFSILNAAAYADSLVLGYNAGKQTVDITLQMKESDGWKPVTLVITEQGSAEFAYIREYETDASGCLKATAGMPDGKPGGKYTVSVTVGGTTIEEVFWHMNFVQAAPSIARINNATTAAELLGLLRSEASDLGIDIDYLNAKASDISAMLWSIIGNKELTPEEFWQAYYTACACAYSKGEANYARIDLLLKSNRGAMGIDYDKLAAAPVEIKNEVYSRFSNGVYTYWDISKQFDEWYSLAQINNASTWNTYYKLISETYAAELGIDFTRYNQSSYKAEIIKDMMAQNFADYQTLRNGFNDAVNKNRSTGGSGSGAGASGGSVSKEMEFAQPQQEAGAGQPSDVLLFSDVPQSHWAYDFINDLCAKGILSGYTDKTFRPGNEVTRAEFSKMLACAFYLGQSGASAEFGDVSPSDWYYPYVALLFEKGVVLGDGNGLFNPNNPISRQDTAVMAMRICGSRAEIREYIAFSDQNDIDGYATESVRLLYRAGILNGMPDGSFLPKGRLSRAEAVKVIYEMLKTGGAV